MLKPAPAWSDLSKARKSLKAAEEALKAVQDEEEFLRHAVAELDQLNPQPGEEGELDSRRRLMQAAEKVKEDVSRAHAAMGYEGAEGAMGDSLRWLEGASDAVDDQLDEPLAALGRALAELSDAMSGVERCMDALDFNPIELEEVEERLFAIRGLARKHNVVPDELGVFAEDLRRKMAALDAGEGEIAELQAAVKKAEGNYSAMSEVLTKARQKAAKALDKAVMAELAPLKMGARGLRDPD